MKKTDGLVNLILYEYCHSKMMVSKILVWVCQRFDHMLSKNLDKCNLSNLSVIYKLDSTHLIRKKYK